MDNLSNALKSDSTHQDKNDEMDTMGLYSCKRCYVSVMPFLLTSTLIQYITTLHYIFGNLTTEWDALLCIYIL